jgi:hypothetical protein
MAKIDFLKRLWIGKKVISISNAFQSEPDNESLKIGYVTGVDEVSQSRTPIPVVHFEGDNEPVLVMSTIIEYSDNVWSLLNKLTPKERWEINLSIVTRFG